MPTPILRRSARPGPFYAFSHKRRRPPAAVCCWWRTTPNLRATWQWPDKTPGPGPSPVPRLDALARRVEFIDGSDGEPEIPTVEALAAYLPMAPETAQKEAGELLEQLPWPRMILDGILVNNDDLERARWRAQAPLAPRRPATAARSSPSREYISYTDRAQCGV